MPPGYVEALEVQCIDEVCDRLRAVLEQIESERIAKLDSPQLTFLCHGMTVPGPADIRGVVSGYQCQVPGWRRQSRRWRQSTEGW